MLDCETAREGWTGSSGERKISRMGRKPEDKFKIQAPSLPEIAAAFDQLHGAHRSRVEFQGSVLTRGALVNAMTIHFLSLSPDEQREVIEAGVARYEAMLQSDDEMEDWRLPAASPGKPSLSDAVGSHGVANPGQTPGGKARDSVRSRRPFGEKKKTKP